MLGHLARRSRAPMCNSTLGVLKWPQVFPCGTGEAVLCEATERSIGQHHLGTSRGSQTRNFLGSTKSDVVKETVNVSWSVMKGFCGRLGDISSFQKLNFVRDFVQLRTNLEVADNSGARRVQCIKVMKGSNAAKIGDIIMASVKDAQPRGKVKKGEVVTCVVVRAATQKLRRDGSEIKFDKNAVVLVNKQGDPIGTRIFGPVPHELRRRKMVKILTLADNVA